MSEHVYKQIELTGSSTKSIDDAISTAITKASKTLRIEHLLARSVSGLSGGDSQRVALDTGIAFVRKYGFLCAERNPREGVDDHSTRWLFENAYADAPLLPIRSEEHTSELQSRP